MTTPQGNTQNSEPENNPPPPVNTGDVETGTIVHEAQRGHHAANNRNHKPKIFKRVIAFFRDNGNQPKVANIVSLGMFIATVILAIYTLKVFQQTQIQSKAAVDAAKAADSSVQVANKTLKADTDYNNKNIASQKTTNRKADSTDSVKNLRDIATFNLQKRALDKQIASLKETQKEFEIENKPFIQALNINFDTLEVGKRMVITFNFINYGKQPIKFITNKAKIYFYDSIAKITKGGEWENMSIKNYISGNATTTVKWKSTDTVNKVIYKYIKDGTIYTYLTGDLEFENTANFNKGIYSYSYKLSYKNLSFDVEGIKDTMMEVKTKKELKNKK